MYASFLKLAYKSHVVGNAGQNTQTYCDFQLSKARGKFGHKVLTVKLPCCQGQLAPSPRGIFRTLTSSAIKHAKNCQTFCLNGYSESYGVSSESRVH